MIERKPPSLRYEFADDGTLTLVQEEDGRTDVVILDPGQVHNLVRAVLCDRLAEAILRSTGELEQLGMT